METKLMWKGLNVTVRSMLNAVCGMASNLRSLFLCLILTLAACDNHVPISVQTEKSRPESRSIRFPYKLIDTKQEIRKNDGRYNQLSLYVYAGDKTPGTLVLFCQEQKPTFQEGYFYFLVFFDEEKYAEFPANPFTAYYIDEKSLRHIRAIYTYNSVNGFSKLDFCEKNMWDSSPQQITID